jgi:hypothetical protein
MKIIVLLFGILFLSGCYSAKSLQDHPERADKYLIVY